MITRIMIVVAMMRKMAMIVMMLSNHGLEC